MRFTAERTPAHDGEPAGTLVNLAHAVYCLILHSFIRLTRGRLSRVKN
jgi:hypothetical protein